MPFLVAAIAAPTEVNPSPCRVCPGCGRRWVQMAGSAFSEPRTPMRDDPWEGVWSRSLFHLCVNGLGDQQRGGEGGHGDEQPDHYHRHVGGAVPQRRGTHQHRGQH